MTPAMVEGLKRLPVDAISTITAEDGQPDLTAPDIAKPISHAQVIQLSKALKLLSGASGAGDGPTTLEELLVGASVYRPPPPPKPETSPEYKALMARLRREEEARAYERMINPPDAYDLSSFAQINRPVYEADSGDDGVTLSDVNRQVMLIFNFVVTMGGVAYALWMLARWWPTPSRLFLSMAGCIATGMIEYGLYAGYVWHLSEAAKRDAKQPKEIREVVHTWTIEPLDVQNGTESSRRDDKRRAADGLKGDYIDSSGKAQANLPVILGASGIDTGTAQRRKPTTQGGVR
ncbi:hypothetical protein SEPCBS119000_003362 [Sporothrix epigloea]|uniref:Vacuolar h+-atpase assembly protein n=1 Tax=Sporothrix epigloea TaxID=1892477 RepID=A0ABP0DL77_9PEZI